MKNITRSLILALGLAFSGAALAADLPSAKSAPDLDFHTLVSPVFVGVNGGLATNSTGLALGASAGYDFGYVRLEGNYRNLGLGKNTPNFITGNVLTGNVVAQYPYGRLTPYVLAGYGYAWRPSYANSTPVWNVGGGARYNLTQNVALDVRYTFTEGTTAYNPVNNAVTGGAEYRF